jgi:HTH-type transcriptional regulator/antitoxin MqsA
MQRLETCPLCDEKIEIRKINRELKYRGKTITIEMAGEYCQACDEGFQNDIDVQLNENTIALAKKRADSIIAEDIARIRKKLGLTQAQASEIFGGGIRAFYKYEKGTINPPQALVILFDLLDKGEAALDDIRNNITQKVA